MEPPPETHDGRVVKFHAHRDVFSEAVSFAVKLLPSRTTLPILSGVLIEAQTGHLTLSSFDYEVSSQTKISAEVEEEGSILVSGRLLAEIAGRLPNAPVHVSTDANRIMVNCGFATAVSQVAPAASRDDVTPVITGVQLEVTGHTASLVATDRYRVAIREMTWESTDPATNITALVPARTLQEIGKT